MHAWNGKKLYNLVIAVPYQLILVTHHTFNIKALLQRNTKCDTIHLTLTIPCYIHRLHDTWHEVWELSRIHPWQYPWQTFKANIRGDGGLHLWCERRLCETAELYLVVDICLEQMDSYHIFALKEDRWTGQTASERPQATRFRITSRRNHLPFLSFPFHLHVYLCFSIHIMPNTKRRKKRATGPN